MFNSVLIQPHELSLKSEGTRRVFEQRLKRNILFLDRTLQIKKIQGSFLIETKNAQALARNLRYIFGISKISPAVFFEFSDSKLRKTLDFFISELKLNSKKTFGVRARVVASNKSSREIEFEYGGYVQDQTSAKVDLDCTKNWIWINLLGSKAVVYNEKIKGYGGLPVGVSGRIAAVIDESKESILAAWMMARRGCQVDFIIKKKNKNLSLLKNFLIGYALKEIKKTPKYDAIVYGKLDLRNIPKSEALIFTPLIGFSKKEIVKLAKFAEI